MLNKLVVGAGCALLTWPAAALSVIGDTGVEFRGDETALELRFYITNGSDTNGYGTYVSYDGYTNLMRRISRMAQLKTLSLCLAFDRDEADFNCRWLAPLANLSELTLAGDYGNAAHGLRLRHFDALARLPVRELVMKGVVVDDWAPLKEFSRLRKFDGPSTFSNQVDCLPDGLTYLRLHDASFCNGTDFSRLVNLRTLIIGEDRKPWMSYSELKGFDALTNLRELELHGDYGYVIERNLLRNCKQLKILYLVNCRGDSTIRLYDVSNLGHLPLESLGIRNASIRHIRGLEKCPLKRLDVSDCHIRSVDDLCAMPNVEDVNAWGTGIESVDVERLKKRFPKLKSFKYTDENGGPTDACREIN